MDPFKFWSLRPEELFHTTKRSNITSFTNLQSSKHFFENIMSCKDISTHFSLFWKWKAFSICGSSCRQQYQQSTDEFDEVSKSRPPIRSDVNFLLGLWLAGGSLTWENIVRGWLDLRSASIDIWTMVILWVMLLSPIGIWWNTALAFVETKSLFWDL